MIIYKHQRKKGTGQEPVKVKKMKFMAKENRVGIKEAEYVLFTTVNMNGCLNNVAFDSFAEAADSIREYDGIGSVKIENHCMRIAKVEEIPEDKYGFFAEDEPKEMYNIYLKNHQGRKMVARVFEDGHTTVSNCPEHLSTIEPLSFAEAKSWVSENCDGEMIKIL